MKAPYIENVRDVGRYDAAVDRDSLRFRAPPIAPARGLGPQGIRRISALYTPYNYELGVDLREQSDAMRRRDVFTIPAISGKEL